MPANELQGYFDEHGVCIKIQTFELILKIQKDGKTVLLIEQNASLALSIADRGYVLENGKITLSGSGKELLGNENIKRAYLGG